MTEELVADLQEVVGDSLRAVGTYDREHYDQVYAREGIDPGGETLERIHENLVLDGIGVAYLEDVFGSGRLHCTMHHFEEAMVFHFVGGEFTGLFVSLDPCVDLPLPRFVERCKRHVGQPA